MQLLHLRSIIDKNKVILEQNGVVVSDSY